MESTVLLQQNPFSLIFSLRSFAVLSVCEYVFRGKNIFFRRNIFVGMALCDIMCPKCAPHTPRPRAAQEAAGAPNLRRRQAETIAWHLTHSLVAEAEPAIFGGAQAPPWGHTRSNILSLIVLLP